MKMKNYIKTLILLLLPFAMLSQNWHEENTIYEYDNLNRLVRVAFNNGTIFEYTYDNLGNRIQKEVSFDPPAVTYVPDDNFEQELINLGYDNQLDDYVLTSNISTIDYLWLNSLNISDLTGIEGFTSLEILHCADNNLVQIDLSQNPALEQLYCTHNELENLDLSNNVNLFNLQCYSNNIGQLELSNNAMLTDLGCGNNPLQELDLSGHQFLEWFECPNSDLQYLNVNNGNNGILTYFYTLNNPDLLCIQVDDESAANSGSGVYSSWVVDNQVVFSEFCENLGIIDNTSLGLILVPNPVEEAISILITDNKMFASPEVTIRDLHGRLILQSSPTFKNNETTVSIANLSSGTYIVSLSENGFTLSRKIVKK